LVEVLELEVQAQQARGAVEVAAAYADDARALASTLGLSGGARLALPAHVDADGGAFLVGGKRVDLSQRVALKGIVRALAQGGVRSTDDLIAAGWPGARLVGDSGPVRLYQALSTLRRLGLEPHLARRDGGYVLVDVTVR
jgi:hypothetical protein